MITTDSPTVRRWTVRAGTDGAGTDLFEVYAPTMEDARASVERSAAEVGAWAPRILPLLLLAGFTVHAGDVSRPAPLGDNPWVRTIPAPDYVAPAMEPSLSDRLFQRGTWSTLRERALQMAPRVSGPQA